MKIGIFDSGMGGKFALEVISKKLPEHTYEIFCDHQNAPYGNKTPEIVFNLTEQGLQKLWAQNCDLILLACNTACSDALRKLQIKYRGKRILGCLIPAIEVAIENSDGRIGLIATKHTVASKKYDREMKNLSSNHLLFSEPTPKLVPWIENGEASSTECEAYWTEKIEALIQKNIDTLILGCTHYHVLKLPIEKKFPQLKIVDSVEAQAEKLVDYLQRHFL